MRATIPKWKIGWLTLALMLTAIFPVAWADAPKQPITPESSIPTLADKKQYATVANFRIGGQYDLTKPESWETGGQGGVTLESLGADPLKIGYIALGTPEKNKQGEIVNAIVISSYYSGDSAAMYNFWVQPSGGKKPVIGPGALIDTDRFYVVMFDALGLWGASKPSGGLGMKFPKYSFYDMVQANYRVLRDQLKVAKVNLATGVSMGGTQTYYWGLMHPELVEAIMPIGGTTQSDEEDPVGNWIFKLMTAAIEGDPHWRDTGGNYYNLPKDQHPNQGVEFGWSVLGLTGLDLNYRGAMPWDKVKGEVFAWKPTQGEGDALAAKSRVFDAVDLIYRNDCGEQHNLNKLLPQMKARTLVVHVATDQWLIVEKAKAAYEAIPGAQFFSFSSPLAHYAVFDAPYLIADDQIGGTFLRDIGVMQDEDTRYDARNYRTPGIALKGDPLKSFWETQVTYPFPVKYAEAKDKRGQTWKIAYMDEYSGRQKNPPTLVIVHGKGAFGAHYGYLMKYALERGLRVIVPDMPGYGMSGPPNLDKANRTRTLQDIREMFNDVIVRQLKVRKAYYLGHSLGGQTVLGYALTYPEAVNGLILEGPAGLEEFPTTLPAGDKSLPLFEPALAYDEAKWKAAWDPVGAYSSELKKQPREIRDFFYFKKTDPKTGAVTEIPMGYFMRDSEYARLHTDQRVAMINGNPKELEQWVFYFIYDVYSIGSELRKEDPNNLYQRLTQIKAPIFLAFGAQEPFIPSTALNGLKDMANEVIKPFIERMRLAGNPLTVKIYPYVGHFIHTDVPYEFAKDAVDFVLTGKVDAVSTKVVDALVNGPKKAAYGPAAGGAAAAKPAGFSK